MDSLGKKGIGSEESSQGVHGLHGVDADGIEEVEPAANAPCATSQSTATECFDIVLGVIDNVLFNLEGQRPRKGSQGLMWGHSGRREGSDKVLRTTVLSRMRAEVKHRTGTGTR